MDAPITPSITSSDEFLDFLFSASDFKYADLKAKAEQQAKKIASDGQAKLDKVKSSIDSKFDEAVDSVVSTILKP